MQLPPIRSSIAVALTALFLVPATVGAHHDEAPHPSQTASGDVHCADADPGSHDFVTPVDGSTEDAYGLFAAPDADPTVLVLLAHGAWHTAESWRGHAEHLTASYSTLSVAMEYRGLERVPGGHLGGDPDHPEAAGWPQKAGGEDLIAAAKRFQAECPSIETTIVLGVSMGGAMSGYALSHLPAGDEGLFDYWIAVEGAHNMLETYHEAKAAGSTAADWMETETGGTPAEVPNEYAERTNVLQTAAIDASGVKRVILMHAVYDGVVPYHHSRQMAAELNLPVEFYTVTSPGDGSDGSTIGDILYPGEGPLAGHATERDANSLLMRASFEQVGILANGPLSDCGEYHVEEGAVFPDVHFAPLVTYGCGDVLAGEPPTARNDAAATTDDTPIDIAVLANDTDPEGEQLTIVGWSQPSNGFVTGNVDGTLHFAPEADLAGTFVFDYTITDPDGNTDSANVVVDVTLDDDHFPACTHDTHENGNGHGHERHGNGKGKGHCKSHDKDDFDDDGVRDDADHDDDNDGIHDDDDDDDDNDGIDDETDDDDDNDGIRDGVDSSATTEQQTVERREIAPAGSDETSIDIDAGTTLLVVSAVADGAEQLVIDLVDPLGIVVATSTVAAGMTSAVGAAPPAGTYTVRVTNLGTAPVDYALATVTRAG